MSKTHYRRVFKSDHLGIADLEDLIEEGSKLVFTVKFVRQEFNVSVAGKKGNFNIAYFVEPIKPLVLNATNCNSMKMLAGGSKFVEDWQNIAVRLYIDPNVKMKGEVVGGVRINPNAPQVKQELTPALGTAWTNAISAYKRDGNLDKVLARMNVSPENQALIAQEAAE